MTIATDPERFSYRDLCIAYEMRTISVSIRVWKSDSEILHHPRTRLRVSSQLLYTKAGSRTAVRATAITLMSSSWPKFWAASATSIAVTCLFSNA